ncbi:MAG: Crp/Fnr family transcriptional regulator [Flavipsychrobacter sp.]|nr:Crp/Fnr family transcriptional regulator [Flavipsychrobacter sp.]
MIPENEISEKFPQFGPELSHEIAETGTIKTFEDGTLLMKTGQYIRSTMIVLSGLVKVYREDEEGGEFFMYYIQPGEACALSLICSSKQDTSELTAKAVGEVELLMVPLNKMDEWMMTHKGWYQYVLGTYRRRFEELLTTIDHIAFRNMDERLVYYLKKHQQTLNSNFIPFTHAEIAQELNSSREVISRLMKKLADRNMIKIHRNNVEILDLNL